MVKKEFWHKMHQHIDQKIVLVGEGLNSFRFIGKVDYYGNLYSLVTSHEVFSNVKLNIELWPYTAKKFSLDFFALNGKGSKWIMKIDCRYDDISIVKPESSRSTLSHF